MRHTDALAALARLADHPELPPSAKGLYAVLVIRSDDEGMCWPGTTRLAAETGYHPGSMRRAARHLEAAGLLLVEVNAGGRREATNLYRLPVGVVHTPRTMRGVEAADPAHDARLPRAPCAPTPRTMRAERLRERVQNAPRAAPDPELDGHEHHRPGDCAECDAGRRRVELMLGDLSVWTPAHDPRIGRWT